MMTLIVNKSAIKELIPYSAGAILIDNWFSYAISYSKTHP